MIPRALGRLSLLLPLLVVAPSAGAATVSGRVLDSGGSPVRGAKVVWEKYRTDEEVLVDETKGAASAPIGETATDAEGWKALEAKKPAAMKFMKETVVPKMAAIIGEYRKVLYFKQSPYLLGDLRVAATALAVLVAGYLFFTGMNRRLGEHL